MNHFHGVSTSIHSGLKGKTPNLINVDYVMALRLLSHIVIYIQPIIIMRNLLVVRCSMCTLKGITRFSWCIENFKSDSYGEKCRLIILHPLLCYMLIFVLQACSQQPSDFQFNGCCLGNHHVSAARLSC